jgi:WD40 repeat protein
MRNSDGLYGVAFSPDGKILAAGSAFAETRIRLWDLVEGRELAPLVGHRSCVFDLLFWPDNQKLASASADQTIRLWDLTSGQPIGTFLGHEDEVWRLALLADGLMDRLS